jgi:hypothetical protein
MPSIAVLFIIVGPVFNSFRNDASAESANKVMELFIRDQLGSKIELKCPNIPQESATDGYIKLKLDVSQLLAASATLKSVITPDPMGTYDDSDNNLVLAEGQLLYLKLGRTKFITEASEAMVKQEVTDFLSYANAYANYAFYPMYS